MNTLFSELGLDTSLLKALEKENISTPTDIQRKVIPEMLKNRDMIVQSETGTGKTLAYLIPLFKKINTSVKEMQAIILVPTHELAIQVLRVAENLSRNSAVKVSAAPIIGNVNIDRQIDKLKEKPDIIIGSSGRILELIKRKKISAHTIKTIILDEADKLVGDSDIETVKAVIKSTMRDRQLLMFSASISVEAEARGRDMMKEPVVIREESNMAVPDTIEHICLLAEQREKFEILRKVARILNPQKALVFTSGIEEAEIITEKLKYHGFAAESIHGTNLKAERKKAMEGFRAGRVQFLIASDLASRGLDIEGVTHVFSMNAPEDPKNYLHRAGRTGRNGNTGMCVSIVTGRELQLIRTYERLFQIRINVKEMVRGNLTDAKPKPASKPKLEPKSKPVSKPKPASKRETAAGAATAKKLQKVQTKMSQKQKPAYKADPGNRKNG